MKKMIKNFIVVLTYIIIGLYCKIVYRYKIEGKENIPKEGNLIFCGNHKSYLDPIFILLGSKRKIRFMAKKELQENFIFKYLFNLFDVIYLKRDSKDIQALKEALKTLKSEGCIGIFPEGTRNGMEKNNGELKDGASYLALKTGAKIIPVGIVGESKPFHKNVIKFGEPIETNIYQTKNKEQEIENKEKITNILKEEIIKLTK